MKGYGNASITLLFYAVGTGRKKLTAANLEQQESNADAGGSAVFHLLRKALFDKLPFEKDDPNAKEIATLLAFKAIVEALEVLNLDEFSQEIEAANANLFRLSFFNYLGLGKPYFLIDAWHEAMNESGWSYHYKKDYVLTDGEVDCKEKTWLQKGKQKVDLNKMQETIIVHLCDLIEFHIRRLAFLLTERVAMEEWLQTFDLDDTPTDRQWLENRLKVILQH